MVDAEYVTTVDALERKNKINIVGRIETKGEVKDINLKAGGTTQLCACKLSDDKGSINLNLWGEDIAKVNQGDIVKILNGYITEFKEDKSLNVGKFGKLEIVEKAGQTA